jgi:hypothetical protein
LKTEERCRVEKRKRERKRFLNATYENWLRVVVGVEPDSK